ncbi:MAG: hypothetical protein HC915_08980 [Anaerolineae bacterium]|nr:hypothetical protein [Anaerolineae bacterium]
MRLRAWARVPRQGEAHQAFATRALYSTLLILLGLAVAGFLLASSNTQRAFFPMLLVLIWRGQVRLAIVKKITDLHQGSIAVQSQLGQGTAFEVRVPLVAS